MIAMFPSKRSADRKRRTINFVNKMKVILRKTKPIVEEGVAGGLGQRVTQSSGSIGGSHRRSRGRGGVPLATGIDESTAGDSGKKDLASNSIRHSTTKEKMEKTKKGGKARLRRRRR